MRVLIVSQYFWPESFRINEVADSLIQAGCQVSILTGQPNYPGGVVYPGYQSTGFGRQQHADVTIYRVPIVPRGNSRAVRLVLNYFSFVMAAGILGPWMLRGKQFDVILVYGISPILQALPAIVLRKIKRAKLVTWVQDLWPASLEVTGFVKNRQALALVAVLVRWIYRRQDLLLTQSRAFIAPVAAMSGKTPVEYHPNPGEIAFSTELRPGDVPALTLEPGFNVVFAGNLGTAQALETIVEAAELLIEQVNIRLVVVGDGSSGGWLAEEVDRRKLTNVQLTGRYPTEAMPGIFSQASALLVTLARSPAMEKTIPSKVQAYLAAGKPIVACLDGEGAQIVEDSGAGFACPAVNAPMLVQTILRLWALSDNERLQMGLAGKRYYRAHFEPEMLARKLLDRFDALVSTKK